MNEFGVPSRQQLYGKKMFVIDYTLVGRYMRQKNLTPLGKLLCLQKLRLLFGKWCWELGRIPMKDNLYKRKIIQGGNLLNCVFCNAHVESAAHLMFDCKFALEIWCNTQ